MAVIETVTVAAMEMVTVVGEMQMVVVGEMEHFSEICELTKNDGGRLKKELYGLWFH